MENHKITPCLWFNDNGTEAVDFYTSAFKNSKTKGITHYSRASSEASGRPKGSVMTVLFELEGQEFLALNGGPYFKFTPALSFFVSCDTEEEIGELWENSPRAAKLSWVWTNIPSLKNMASARTNLASPGSSFSGQDASKKSVLRSCSPKNNPAKPKPRCRFYTSLFKNSKTEKIAKDPKSGVVLHARFSLAGQDFVAMESPVEQPYGFTPATSFIVNCDSQQEIDYVLERTFSRKRRRTMWLVERLVWHLLADCSSRSGTDAPGE